MSSLFDFYGKSLEDFDLLPVTINVPDVNLGGGVQTPRRGGALIGRDAVREKYQLNLTTMTAEQRTFYGP